MDQVGDGNGLPWPAAQRREVAWHTNPDQHGPDGRRPNYDDRMLTSVVVEVPPEIADVPVDLTPDLAERCRQVEGEIARLDAQHGAHLVGLSSFLIRSESVASSRIERVYADLDDVARASIAEEASRPLTLVEAREYLAGKDAEEARKYLEHMATLKSVHEHLRMEAREQAPSLLEARMVGLILVFFLVFTFLFAMWTIFT